MDSLGYHPFANVAERDNDDYPVVTKERHVVWKPEEHTMSEDRGQRTSEDRGQRTS
jgi:hypothetical protein